MEYLVTMTTHVPDGTSEQAVADIRTREAAQEKGAGCDDTPARGAPDPAAPRG